MESPDAKASRRKSRRGRGISLQTLIIASVASAAASFAVARIWGPGTLIGAAAAPVIVALLSEFLRRPVQSVTETAKRGPMVRLRPGVPKLTVAESEAPTRGQEDRTRVATDPTTGTEPYPPFERPRPRRRVEPDDAVTPGVGPGTIRDVTANTWGPRWQLALVTGSVAFAIVVGVFTVPDLLAGRSITGNGRTTTFFGGSANAKKTTRPTTTVPSTTTPTTTAKTTPAQTATKPTTTGAKTTTKPTTTPTHTQTAITTTQPTSTGAPPGNPTTTPTIPGP